MNQVLWSYLIVNADGLNKVKESRVKRVKSFVVVDLSLDFMVWTVLIIDHYTDTDEQVYTTRGRLNCFSVNHTPN